MAQTVDEAFFSSTSESMVKNSFSFRVAKSISELENDDFELLVLRVSSLMLKKFLIFSQNFILS